MKKLTESLFLDQITVECKNIIFLAKSADNELGNDEKDLEQFFNYLRYIVIHAAMISKYFWPIHEKNRVARERGAYLVNLIGYDIKALKDRTLRNHLEHFDERIDEYNSACCTKYVIDGFPPSENEILIGFGKAGRWHYFNTVTYVYEILGDSFNIRDLVDEATTILNRIRVIQPV